MPLNTQGTAARALYRKYGFTEEKPIEHDGLPRCEMKRPALTEKRGGSFHYRYPDFINAARQTSEPLARYMSVEIEYLEKLREHNIGEGVGKRRQWAKENILTVNTFDDPQFNGAETWREFWERVTDLCNDIIADKADNIILVSHGGTLAVLHQVWIGADIQQFSRFGSPDGVSFMELNNKNERSIARLNDMSYIEGVTV